MIATHNIKVNGRWVRAGESYEPQPEQMQIELVAETRAEPAKVEAVQPVFAKPAAENKPKKTTRRKTAR